MFGVLSAATRRPVVAVVLAALIINVSVLWVWGITEPVESDTIFYAEIAKNLTEGRGYVNLRSPWPDKPTTDRLPGWTAIIALGLMATGGTVPIPVLVRVLAGLFNVLAAALLTSATLRVTSDRDSALLAGLAYVVYLPALYLAGSGLSEIAFVCVLIWSVMLVVERRWLPGCFLLGAGCLFRGNMLLLAPFLAAVLLFRFRLKLALVAACMLAFAVAPGLWMIRNAVAAPGCVGILTSATGEVLRGSLNPVVMYGWENWGYWVFPNDIPGEPDLREVAATRTQCETAKFYQARAVQFAKDNWTGLPLLMVGRIARAYLPFTTHITPASVAGFGVRGILLALGILTWGRWRRLVDGGYQAVLAALFAVSLVTTLALVAAARHTFWLEVMAFPCVAAGAVSWWKARRQSGQ